MGWASADTSAMRSTIEGRNSVQSELVTTSAKLPIAKVSLIAMFDHLKRHFSNGQAVETALQQSMKSNLQNYIQTVLGQVNQGMNSIRWASEAIFRH